MILRTIGRTIILKYIKLPERLGQHQRKIHLTCTRCQKEKEDPKQLIVQDLFENIQNKNRDTYLDMIRIFVNRNNVYRRGHVEFIYSAMKSMESFGVQKDLAVYKALVDVLPKGKFIATNMFQVEFMHYPKQQQCIIDLLEQMEDNGVMPDYELEDILTNIFGNRAFPLRKFWRMMYWMPKFKNLSPWPVPDPLPGGIFEQAQLAIKRISSVDLQSEISIYQTSEIQDAIDDTWIVSAQSPTQKRLLSEHDVKKPLYVEGDFRVWLKKVPVNYFILRTEPKPFNDDYEDLDDVSNISVSFFDFGPSIRKQVRVLPSVHEQEDGVILAVCATGTSSKDSLLSWIRHLEKDGNPVLAEAPIVFTLKQGSREVATVDDESGQAKEQIDEK